MSQPRPAIILTGTMIPITLPTGRSILPIITVRTRHATMTHTPMADTHTAATRHALTSRCS